MASNSGIFSCNHVSNSIPKTTSPSPSPSTSLHQSISPTYSHPCRKCMSLAAKQQQDTIKQRYLQQQEVLTTSIAETNQAVIAAKGEEMRDFREDGSGGKVRHRVAVAEIEVRMFEISKAEGDLGDLKRRERRENDEAWREYDKLWSSLSSRFPDMERELRYEGIVFS